MGQAVPCSSNSCLREGACHEEVVCRRFCDAPGDPIRFTFDDAFNMDPAIRRINDPLWFDRRSKDQQEFAQQSCSGPRMRSGTSFEAVHDTLPSRAQALRPHASLLFSDYYQLGKSIGKGSFGDVFEAVTLPSQHAAVHASGVLPHARQRVAVKVFPATASGDPNSRDTAIFKSFSNEAHILSHLDHPNIVKLYESFQEKSAFYMVLELCRGGELYDLLAGAVRQGGYGGLGERAARSLFRQMLCAVSYLHSNSTCHRDVKPENFLLLGEPGTPHAKTLKLCDFGVAGVLHGRESRFMDKVGTLSYTAPEVYERRGGRKEADSWSLGVVLYMLLTGLNPFRLSGESKEETEARICRGELEQTRAPWLAISEEGKDLVRNLLVVDESLRLRAAEALRHPWMQSDPQVQTYQGPVLQLLPLLDRFQRFDSLQRWLLALAAKVESELSLQGGRASAWCDLFLALDTDMDGQLSYREMAEGLLGYPGSSNLNLESLLALAQAMDLDQNGVIEWTDWFAVALMDDGDALRSSEPLGTVFRLLNRPEDRSSENGLASIDETMSAYLQPGAQGAPPGMQSPCRSFSTLQRAWRDMDMEATV